jgi:aryl-alcohol dehydrogenase-like predicted oxidoreductase
MGLGCWQLGDDCWGDIGEEQAQEILVTAFESGTTFFDTADVYGGGLSERRVGKFLAGLAARDLSGLTVATKIGRFGQPGWPGNFTRSVMREHILASAERLGVEALDLVQLHCLPTEILVKGEVFDSLREFQKEGIIKNWGVSIESVEEGLLCLTQPGIASLQVIFNALRQKPAHILFPRAEQLEVSIIVRLPLASGLLSGKFSASTTFAANDHRNWNKDGEAFHVGETFNGIPYLEALEMVSKLKETLPEGYSLAEASLRWILDHSAVSVIIPGASKPEQVKQNHRASMLAPLDSEVHRVWGEYYRSSVEKSIRGNL